MQTSACSDGPTLLEWAKARARHVGTARVVAFEIDGLPSPQVCIHSPVHSRYVVIPWRLPHARHEMCTVPVERDASPFRAVLQLEGDSGRARTQRFLVNKGVAQARVNQQSASPFQPDAFRVADSATIVSAEEPLRRRAPECLWPVAAGSCEAHSSVMIHRFGSAPVTVPCPSMLTPSDMALSFAAAGLIPPHTRLQLPWACPHLPGIGPHFIVPGEDMRAQQALIVVDLRRVVTPPSVLFWTTGAPSFNTVTEAQSWIAAEFPLLLHCCRSRSRIPLSVKRLLLGPMLWSPSLVFLIDFQRVCSKSSRQFSSATTFLAACLASGLCGVVCVPLAGRLLPPVPCL